MHRRLLVQPNARRFLLQRNEDETGISGVGYVAEGVEFANGRCVLSWLTCLGSIGVYQNILEVEAIHGHEGRTKIVWIDD